MEKFPKMPQKCPILPGQYGLENFIIGHQAFNDSNNVFALKLTQGFYRHVVKLSTPQEKDIFLLYWIIQIIDDS